MRTVFVVGAVLLTGLGRTAVAHEPTKVTLIVSGVVCEGCAKELRAVFAKAEGIKKLEVNKIAPSQGPVRLTGVIHGTCKFGALAKAVNEANTPHKAKSRPGLALVYFARLDEKSARAAHEALGTLPGVDAQASTADPKRGEIRVGLTGDETFSQLEVVQALGKAGIRAKLATPSKDNDKPGV